MSAQKRKALATSSGLPAGSKDASHKAKKLKSTRPKDDESSDRKLPTTSILLEEEKTFPRGRGNGLTPIEKKQIQLKADRDVLFEESGRKPPRQRDDEEGDFDSEDDLEAEKPPTKKQKNKDELRQENARKRDRKAAVEVERPKAKGLKPGDIVEGRVGRINEDDYDHFLIVEWENNRKSTVPITAISQHLTKTLESILGDDDNEGEAEDNKNEPDLKRYFKKGQPLKAAVTKVIEASHDTSGKPTRGSVQLSIDPRQVNKGITKGALTEQTKIQAAVESVEDHGLIMDFGLDEKGVKGFLSSSELPAGRKMSQMKDGMVLLCVVSGTSSNGKVIKLSANHPDLAGAAQDHQPNLGLKNVAFTNPVDEDLKSLDSLMLGHITKARITSVKDTQLNTVLADNVQGRIDASEAFQSLDDIQDRKHPLKAFNTNQVIPVRILGIHDARNHKFLPISHRGGHVPVFELSARLGKDDSVMSFDQLKEGEAYMATVNNVSGSNLWVNMSPSIRGRIERMDLPEDISDVGARYPIGAAIPVWVKRMDLANNHLDLSTRPGASAALELKLEDFTKGMIIAGRVTKVEDHRLFIQLSPSVSGVVSLTEMADDFDEATPHKHVKNDMIRVCVTDVDQSNKRVTLSARPSRVLSSSLPVKDKQITHIKQLKKNDLTRGFIQKVDDIGLFISLAPGIKAFVPVAELSDSYIKDWKPDYQVDKIVIGRVIEVDPTKKRVHLSLKQSAIESGYKPILRFEDVKKGDVVTGKIRKVEEFGVFIVVDNSHNVSGLCHRSQIADRRVEDARGLYDEGEAVTAVVVKIDVDKKRISFSLKPSAFEDKKVQRKLKALGKEAPTAVAIRAHGDSDVDMDDTEAGVDLPVDADGNLQLSADALESLEAVSDDGDAEKDGGVNVSSRTKSKKRTAKDSDDGLDAGGFDWNPTARKRSPSVLSDAPSEAEPKKKRKKRAAPYEDHTADVADHGPRSSADFERLLMANSDDPALWVQYMSHHVSAGDIPTARKIAERATRSIGITRDQEKLEVWTAWLNLELAFGEDTGDVSDEAMTADPTGALGFLRDVPLGGNVKEVFANACAVHDRTALSERLVKSLAKFRKLDPASALYERMSHDKAFTPDPAFWIKYASFLMRDAEPHRPQDARALVPRATQILPEREHARILMEFARLEFKLRPESDRGGAGDPERGRTLFTELLSVHPKRFDFWDVWLSLEESLLLSIDEKDKDAKQEQEDRMRDLFERQTGEGAARMKKKRAQGVFERWLKFEQAVGKGKSEMERAKKVDRVKARERRYTEQRLKREKEREEKSA